MKKITLETLSLLNFKGIKSFSLNAGSESVDIYGQNETGKTTLVDAFLWGFFGKDSQGRKDFSIKALDADGEEAHNLDHCVDVTVMIDDHPHTPRRLLKEKWTKKRGSAKASFTGHTTEYFIDGVPRSEKEYKAWVDEIIGEDLFRLLTDPRFFCGQHWETQRAALMEICGDIDPASIIEDNKKLAPLAAHLRNMSPEDCMAVLKARAKKINEELTLIPARIDECNKSMEDGEDVTRDMATIEESIRIAREARQDAEKRRLEVQHGGEVARLSADLVAARSKRDSIVDDHRSSVRRRAGDAGYEISKLVEKMEHLEGKIKALETGITSKQQLITKAASDIEAKRQEWRDINAKPFVFSPGEPCRYCGALPEHQINNSEEAQRRKFNADRATAQDRINSEGKDLTAKKALLEKECADAQADIANIRIEIADIKKVVTDYEQIKARIENEKLPAEWEAAALVVTDLEYQIDQAKTATPDTSAIDAEIAQATDDEKLWMGIAEKQRSREKALARISELEAEEKKLVREFEEIQQELYLWDEYTRASCDLLEARINSRFTMTRWKLFENQINEGVKPICTATYKGVPYKDLNNAARINVGLDIINTLSAHYGVTAPIFIDNAEAITSYIPTTAQLIKLIVSADHKKLTVEPAAASRAAA